MDLFSLEQDRVLVGADFAFYGLVVAGLGAAVVMTVPEGRGVAAAGCVAGGAAAWTLAEYLLHRWVLHGVQPFKRWHALHHARPLALIATPTLLTAALFALLVALPAWWLFAHWAAAASMLGVQAGYLAYIVTHHSVHHAHGRGAWLRSRKRWHALHHHAGARARYGVSVSLWDHLLGSARP